MKKKMQDPISIDHRVYKKMGKSLAGIFNTLSVVLAELDALGHTFHLVYKRKNPSVTKIKKQ